MNGIRTETVEIPQLPNRPAEAAASFLQFLLHEWQIRHMRGSPLVRFIFITVALAISGVGLTRVTSSRSNAYIPIPVLGLGKAEGRLNPAPFHLLLSTPARSVEINTSTYPPPSVDGSLISGKVDLDPNNPRIALVVRWKNPEAAGEHRFAKLTLEVPGQDTLSHVFDAKGDIDDVLELPFSADR